MAEEYFGTPMTEVKVKQPPKVAPINSLKAVRKEANKQLREHRKVMKAARERIKGIRKEVKALGFGRRMAQAQKSHAKQQIRELNKEVKHQKRVHRQVKAYQVQAKKLLRARNAQLKQQIRQHKKSIKAMKAKMNPRVRQQKHRREQSLLAKSLKWGFLLKMAKKAFKKKKSDGRNHGFTGSGKGGRTGRAGFWR